MKRIDIFKSYIEKIDNIQENNKEQSENLIEEISRICIDPDELRELVLDYYYDGNYAEALECSIKSMPYQRTVAYQSDLRKLRAKLKFEIAVLEDKEEQQLREEIVAKEERELEKLRLEVQLAQRGPMVANHINASSNANSQATSNVKVSVTQTIDSINTLSDNVLSKKEKEELEDKISAVDVASKSKDSAKTWSKVGNVLKYIADKGGEVGIATLPYMNEIIKLLGN